LHTANDTIFLLNFCFKGRFVPTVENASAERVGVASTSNEKLLEQPSESECSVWLIRIDKLLILNAWMFKFLVELSQLK